VSAFLEYPNLKRVLGVELHSGRFQLAVQNLRSLVDSDNKDKQFELTKDDKNCKQITEIGTGRTLTMRQQNLFDVPDAFNADIVFLETDIPATMWYKLAVRIAESSWYVQCV